MDTQVRIKIDSREPFADGQEFERVGAYEALVGTVDFAIDPDDVSNETVTDLELAPRNDEGLVEYSTDLYILKPLDLSSGNGRLLYDVNNRGNLRAMQFFNDGVLTLLYARDGRATSCPAKTASPCACRLPPTRAATLRAACGPSLS